MPIYCYICTSCDEQIEKLQKISDDRLKQCPSCDAFALERQLTAPNFRLSGSGWYETDYKGDKDKKKNLTNYKNSSSDKPKESNDKKTKEKPTTKESTSNKKVETKQETPSSPKPSKN